jgi:putative transcriptional regulator
MKTQFEEMMSGLDDVEAFLAGQQTGFKVHVPQHVDVKAIRNRLRMTQARFSDVFGFSLDAIKHWEGGRRTPEAPARTLLTVIDRNPTAVLTALKPAAFAAPSKSSAVIAKNTRKYRKSSPNNSRTNHHGARSHPRTRTT